MKKHAYMGHEKEPPQPHGPKEHGHPPVHSHSARPQRKIAVRKNSGRKRSM